MDATEFGAYMSLIISCYQCKNKLPKDDKRLSRMARVSPHKWGKIKDVVLDKFDDKNTHFEQSFVKKDLQRIESLSKKNTANALKGNRTPEPVAKRSRSQTPANTKNKELITNNKEKKEPPLPPKGNVVVPDFINADVWIDFVKHRGGSKFTRLMATRTINQLTKWNDEGHDANEVLNQSIMNGWKGIFEPKAKEKNILDLRDEILQEMNEEDERKKLCLIETH